jgi:hypothetical protein
VIVVPSHFAAPKADGLETGRSAGAMARKVGAAALPEEGPAKNVLAVCVARTAVSVPAVVTGDPLTVKIAGSDNPTLVTDPLPPV